MGSDWVVRRLGDFAWDVNERASDGVLEVLSVTKHAGFMASLDFFGKQVFSKDTSNYKIVRRGQFAYATIHLDEGSVDCLNIRDAGIISPMYTVFDVDEAVVDRRYMLELLKSPGMLQRYAAIGAGSVNRRRSISFDTLAAEELRLPPLAEQKKIAQILSSVDEAIEATQAVIDQTRRVKEAMLQTLLTRGLGHTRFKQTEIGEIPEAWEVRRLEDICTRVGVGIACSATHAYRANGVPMLRNQNIKPNQLDLSDLLFIDEAFDEENRTKRLQAGDVVTIRTGYPGISAVVPPELNNAQSFTTLVSTPRPEIIRSEFLASWINGPIGRRLVLAGEAGGAQHNLNAGELRRMPVVLPPINEQDRIVDILSAISAAELASQRANDSLHHSRTALLQTLLSGQTRVTP